MCLYVYTNACVWVHTFIHAYGGQDLLEQLLNNSQESVFIMLHVVLGDETRVVKHGG